MSQLIGVLGPEGTFSEKAAKRFSPGAEIRYFRDFEEVIAAVEEGAVEALRAARVNPATTLRYE